MNIEPKNMTHSALVRFVQAVDAVMDADDIDNRERTRLICHWAYQFTRADMPEQLAAAIKRCQADPYHLMLNATSKISSITGQVVAFNPGD